MSLPLPCSQRRLSMCHQCPARLHISMYQEKSSREYSQSVIKLMDIVGASQSEVWHQMLHGQHHHHQWRKRQLECNLNREFYAFKGVTNSALGLCFVLLTIYLMNPCTTSKVALSHRGGRHVPYSCRIHDKTCRWADKISESAYDEAAPTLNKNITTLECTFNESIGMAGIWKK